MNCAASFWSISAFYVIAHRELFPKTWKRAFLFLPALMAAGVALTIINSRAVFEALIGYLPFADSDAVLAELRVALTKHALKDGKADPLLLAALWRLAPTRRAPGRRAL